MHKKVNSSILCFACLCLLPFVAKAESESTGLQTAGAVFSSISISTILASFPRSVFDNTTEGIDQQEMDILLQNRESDNWMITENNPGQLIIENKHSNSTLNLYAYSHGSNAMLITQTVNVWRNLHSYRFSYRCSKQL